MEYVLKTNGKRSEWCIRGYFIASAAYRFTKDTPTTYPEFKSQKIQERTTDFQERTHGKIPKVQKKEKACKRQKPLAD